MALRQSRLVSGTQTWLHSYANARFSRFTKFTNARFARFMGVSALALTTSLVVLGLCDGVFHLTSIPAALLSQIAGALVSYVLSRRAWERTGRPDLLRETIPFWIVFGVATVISTLATKLGYYTARSMNLHGFEHVMVVEAIYLAANIATFLMRFVIFHYILFADRKPAAEKSAAEKQATEPGTAAAPGHPESPELAEQDSTPVTSSAN